MTHKRLLCAALAVPLVAALAATTVSAQRRPPIQEILALVGRRYVVPVPSEAAGASHLLQISNAGWGPATVAVVAVGPAPSSQCPTGFARSQVLAARCLGEASATEPLGAAALAQAPIDPGQATHLFVYSISAAAAEGACASLGQVQGHQMDLAAWERSSFAAGEPLGVTLASSAAGGAYTVVSGQAAVADMVPGTPFAGMIGAPYVPPGGEARVIALSADCGVLQGRFGAAAAAECGAVAQFGRPAVPMSSVSLPPQPAAGGFAFNTDRPLVTLIDVNDESGWYTTQMPEVTVESRQLYFPLAGGLADSLRSELLVTNHHITATATIDIFMLGTGGTLLNLYTDPVPICPGGTHSYDVTTLAGALPGGGRGAAILSLRVTSTNRELAAAPPISGELVVRSAMDAAAYAGSDNSVLVTGIGGGRDQTGTPVMVLPAVRRNQGQPPLTTIVAMQSTRGAGNSQVFVDFYDERGRLVVDDAYFQMRGDGAAIMDLSRPMSDVGGGNQFTLPDGFLGTALIRPAQPRDNLAVVAFELQRRPAQAAAVRAGARLAAMPLQAGRAPFAMWEGNMIIRPPDPSLPTQTPMATPMPTANRPTPTPTATGPDTYAVFLPVGFKDSSSTLR